MQYLQVALFFAALGFAVSGPQSGAFESFMIPPQATVTSQLYTRICDSQIKTATKWDPITFHFEKQKGLFPSYIHVNTVGNGMTQFLFDSFPYFARTPGTRSGVYWNF